MGIAEVAKLLAGTEACRGIAESDLQSVASAGEIKVGWEGIEVIHEGDLADSMIMLLDGTVSILKSDLHGRTREIDTSGAGTVLGEIALLDAAPRTATVKATSPIRYFEIGRQAFESLLDANDRAAIRMTVGIARILARRHRQAGERLVKLLVQVSQQGEQPDVDKFVRDLVIDWED